MQRVEREIEYREQSEENDYRACLALVEVLLGKGCDNKTDGEI